MISGALGGPLGAIGAGLITPIAILAERSLAPDMERATIERYIYESLRNAVSAGVAGAFSEWLSGVSGESLRNAFAAINKKFGGKIAGAVISTVDGIIYALLKRCVDEDVIGYFLIVRDDTVCRTRWGMVFALESGMKLKRWSQP